MVQIPIINGIYTDAAGDFRTAYPVNLIPVPKGNGISQGYLRPADGIVPFAAGFGPDRGAINWNGVCYRVMGSKLVSVDQSGVVSVLGDVGTNGSYVTFDYGFDRLGIVSNGLLYYWDGTALSAVTDPDIGVVNDMIWIDGYFMTTDGTSLVVTELNDPMAVNPLKYGSSEADPDPVMALLKLRNEAVALNANTIEFFDNVGGQLFPFQRIEGAQIEKGVAGTHACCIYMEAVAFLGGGFNEAPGVYLGANGSAAKISTREIDTLLLTYTAAQLAEVKLDARNDKAGQFLYVHLPDRTVVFDAAATAELQGEPVWFTLTSAIEGFARYRAVNIVWCYDRWLCGDAVGHGIGYLTDRTGHHFGDVVRWEFGTSIVYNESNGAQFHELELVALTGRIAVGENPIISTSYSVDGMAWSQPRAIRAGTSGNRTKRLVWLGQGAMRNWRIQRFQGTSSAHLSFARLEARLEPLAL